MLQHSALSEYRPIVANSPQSHSFFSMADLKLTLIPIIFITLRIWSTVRFILLLADSPVRQNPVLVTLHVSLKSCSFVYDAAQLLSFVATSNKVSKENECEV